jgi:ketosteroid isomerase-like protein
VHVATLQVSEHWGTFNSVWRTQNDGSWKVVFDAGNEAAEAPPEEIQALLDSEADSP